MAEPFSTNELFLRSDRIAFGKIPPEVTESTEQTLILPDLTGSKLYFGLSSLVSTSGLSGTLEAIYPNNASFTFDNLNSRLGINVSTPQYSIDISTLTGVRIQGGSLIANASGLVSVPTASLFSTLPSYVFAPGTIPVTAIASTGGSILPGVSVPTSALFSTLPTTLFAPSSIPLIALQSSGIIVASSFVGSGFYLSNIPLANINGTITGDFFRPNSIPLSTLASTGQIWIRNPEGSIFVPTLSTSQLLTSSLTARNISTVNLTTNRFIASSIQANYFESAVFAASNLSAINIKASSLEVLCMISAGTFYGDGQNITNLTPAFLNNVIPSDKFGYRLISINAINPYGNWQWIAGTFTLQQAAPIVSLGDIQASSFHGGIYFGDGRGLYNLPSISTASLVSTVRGLGTVGYVSSQSLTSSLTGLGTINYVSTASLVSTVIGLSHSGFISSSQLNSTIAGLGTLGYISSSQLLSTVAGLEFYTSSFIDTTEITSTVVGLGTTGYVSTLSLVSTVTGLASAGYISSSQLFSTTQGLGNEIRTSSLFASSIQNTFLYTQNAHVSSLEATNISSFELVGEIVWAKGVNASNSVFIQDGGLLVQNLTGVVPYTVYLEAHGRDLQTQYLINDSNQWLTLVSQTSGNYIFNNFAGTDVLSLTRAGKVGVLCNTPSYTFDVNGDIHASGIFYGDGSALYNLNAISSLSLASTVQGLGNSGYVSTASLYSSINQSVSSFSTAIGIGIESNLASTVTGLGSAGYVSSLSLVSTTQGLETYISSFIDPTELASSITSTVIGIGLGSNLASTVKGLGSAGYVSSLSLASTVTGLATSGYVSSLSLASTVTGLGSAGYISTLSLVSTTQGLETYISSFIDPTELASSITSTVIGIGLGSNLASTVQGLGSAGYVSTLSLVSTTQGLQTYISSFIDPTELASSITSTVIGIGLGSNLASTVTGLGSAGYVSTLSLVSTTQGLGSNLASTVQGLGSADYVSTLSLVSTTQSLSGNLLSTVIGLGTSGYVSSLSLVSTTQGLQTYISSFIDPTELASTITSTVIGIGLGSNLASTVTGLGSAGYVSTLSLVSTTQTLTNNLFSSVIGLGTSGYVSSFSLLSTVQGLGTSGYVSSLSLVSTTQGLQTYISSFIDPTELASTITSTVIGIGLGSNLASTVTGLGSSGYVSTLSLLSTVQGLGTSGYVSTASLVSTVSGLGTTWFNSTIAGLGTSGYISTLSLNSTIAGLGTSGYISTLSLNSTIAGLGTAGYVSTASLVSTTSFLQNEIQLGFSTLSTIIQATAGYNAQTLYLNQSVDVTPYKELGLNEIITGNLYSTITSVPGNSDSNLLCAFQTDFPLPSFIPSGLWDLNLFADSGAANSILFFYNLYFRASGGSESLLFQSKPVPVGNTGVQQYTNSLAVSYTPITNGSTIVMKVFASNINAPARTVTCYFQDGYYSHVHTSFNPVSYSGGSGVSSLSTTVASNYDYFVSQFLSTNLNLYSTVGGLGSAGYVSTLSLYSSINGSLSTFSTAIGPGGTNMQTITSTVQGLGSAGYVSTASLVSSITGSLSSFSTAIGPGGTNMLTITSTVEGLGSAGYVSTLSLYSSINGSLSSFSTALGAVGGGGITTIPSILSTSAIFTSSLQASTLIASSIFTSSITGSQIQFITLSSQALFVSSFYTATRQATPMFISF